MKIKTKLLGLISLAVIAAAAFVVQSCMQEDMGAEEPYVLTRADMVVASPEFQGYYAALTDHTNAILASFAKLPKEGKKKLNELSKAHKGGAPIDYLAEVSALVGWDLKEGYAIVRSCRKEIDFQGISNAEYNAAYKRYTKSLATIKTRNIDPQEISVEELAKKIGDICEQWNYCISSCDTLVYSCYETCSPYMYMNDPQGQMACVNMCANQGVICDGLCDAAQIVALAELGILP